MNMKTTTIFLVLCLLVSGVTAVAGENSKWTGWLTDAKCAANGAKTAHKGCAIKCVEGGQAMVFVGEDKKVYKLEGSDKIKSLVGDKVVLSGTLDKETIRVTSAKKAEIAE